MDRKTKKIVLAVTLSAVAAILITVAVLGVIIYHDYKEMYAKQQAIIKRSRIMKRQTSKMRIHLYKNSRQCRSDSGRKHGF